MPTKVEQARDLLAERLEELDGEREQLTAAIAQLDQASSRASSPIAVAAPRRRGSSRRRATTKTSIGTTRRKRALQ